MRGAGTNEVVYFLVEMNFYASLPGDEGSLMAQQQPARRKMQPAKSPVSIPDKLYFRIGDVAELCGLPAYVLRFWETEFPQLKPHKGGSGQRLYRKRDVEIVLTIKHLLYDEGFTIAGARRLLVEKRHTPTVLPQRSDAEARHEPGQSGRTHPPTTSKSGKPSALAAAASKSADGSQFNELRNEMRALLTILGAEESERSSIPVASRPKKKARENANEPTLF